MPAARRWAESLLAAEHAGIVDEVVAVADELGTTPAVVAVAWLAARPAVSSVILGPRTPDQLEDTLAGLELELPPDAAARLDAASAPPNHPVTGIPPTLAA